jgi:hypothetical protein
MIAEALKFNNTVVHLDLSSNDIGQDGAAVVFDSLAEN